MTKVAQPEDINRVNLAHQREGGKEMKKKKTPAKSCSDWLTRMLMAPFPSMSAAAKGPGRDVLPATKAIMRTTSETLTMPFPLASPRTNGGLGGAVNEGGGGEGGGKGVEQIGGPVKNCALFGGVHSRSGLSAIFLQEHTNSLKSK